MLCVQEDGEVEASAFFGMPAVAVAALSGGLFFGYDCRAGSCASCCSRGGFTHGGVEGVEVMEIAIGEVGADGLDIKGHYASPKNTGKNACATRLMRKLMSTAGAECVIAPELTKFAPVCA